MPLKEELKGKIDKVKRRLEGLETLSQLSREEFCEEDGYAYALAEGFGDKLKPAQLYKFFHEIKRVQQEVKKEGEGATFERGRILSLLPMLAYSTGRGLIPPEFYDILKMCLSKERLKTNEDFLRFAEFMEAIMAFHKYIEIKKGGG